MKHVDAFLTLQCTVLVSTNNMSSPDGPVSPEGPLSPEGPGQPVESPLSPGAQIEVKPLHGLHHGEATSKFLPLGPTHPC